MNNLEKKIVQTSIFISGGILSLGIAASSSLYAGKIIYPAVKDNPDNIIPAAAILLTGAPFIYFTALFGIEQLISAFHNSYQIYKGNHTHNPFFSKKEDSLRN